MDRLAEARENFCFLIALVGGLLLLFHPVYGVLYWIALGVIDSIKHQITGRHIY